MHQPQQNQTKNMVQDNDKENYKDKDKIIILWNASTSTQIEAKLSWKHTEHFVAFKHKIQ